MVQSLRRRITLRMLFSLILLCASLPVCAEELPENTKIRFAAEVGTARIRLEQILEVWGPAWYETVAQAARGDLSAAECNKTLQDEWKQALETVIREEIFYQEAEREFEHMLVERARLIYQSQSRGSSATRGANKSLARIERDLRAHFQKTITKQLTDFVDRHIRAAGGLEQLKRVLSGRGLSWSEWRERLRKKAFAQQHLHNVVGPRVPNHPRPVDIRDFYRDHKDEFTTPGRVVFRHILFSFAKRGGEDGAQAAAGSVYDALAEERVTFEAAARKYSDDPDSRARGGLESEVSPDADREAWLSEIRGAVRSQKPGEIGPILLSTAGAHLVQLIRAEPGTPMPFRDAQREIKQRLHASQWEVEVDRFYEEIREKVRVKILVPHVPSEYRYDSARLRGPHRPRRHVGPGARPEIESLSE